MGTFISIYLIGWILAIVYTAVLIFKEFQKCKYIEYDDLFILILFPMLSWIFVIVMIIFDRLGLFGKILYDARDKEEE